MNRELGNQYFIKGLYDNAIQIYTELLENDDNNYLLYSNRSATYIKKEQYELALKDAIKSLKIKSDYGKSWGRLGASLYGLKKYDEALMAYNKAYDIEPLEIYKNMIEEIKNNKNSESLLGNYTELLEKMINNKDVMDKLNDLNFQQKLLKYQSNPMDAINDHEIVNVIKNMMKSLGL
jgi:stress-induced-phosphoprotein 1